MYESLVSARAPKKQNDLKSDHQDLHFCRAQAGYFFEAAEMFKDDTLCLAADDKTKINVGTLAVSRYHQISKFLQLKDFLNNPDHDFLIPGYKITPSGYHFLQTEKRSTKKCGKTIQSRSLTRSNKVEKQIRSKSLLATLHGVQDDNSRQILNSCITDKAGQIHLKCGKTGPVYVFHRAQLFHSSTLESHAKT